MPNESDNEKLPGLVCHRCGCRHFFVVYTRPRLGGIIRRRECRYCGTRILTYERKYGEASGNSTPGTPYPAEPSQTEDRPS